MHLRLLPLLLLALGVLRPLAARAQEPPPCVLVAMQGEVRIALPGGDDWMAARTNLVLAAGTRVRTGTNGMALLRLRGRSLHRLGPDSEIRTMPPAESGVFRQFLQRGLHYFFDRDGDLEVETSTTSGLTLGTEFVVRVEGEAAQESVEVTMFDGSVALRKKDRPEAPLPLKPGEQGRVEPGRPPRITGVLQATNVIQWFLYYPAVIDPAELALPPEAASALAEVLARYRSGDLVGAFDAWPAARAPRSPSEQAFLAALRLGLGDVEAARKELAAFQRNAGAATGAPGSGANGAEGTPVLLSAALRRVIAAVTSEGGDAAPPPTGSPSRLLAESYFAQSRNRLPEALAFARQAVARSADFGFGWARVAELEFSSGDIPAATAAAAEARRLVPRHAQAVALEGFLLAARNRTHEARDTFARAIALDPRLGNAWLGRGLCEFRLGDPAAGLADLEAAAALEPDRALLRSSLGKAWQENREPRRAREELAIAVRSDPSDPTAPFYTALLDHEENRVNAAVDGLERALALNDNRAVFRSRLRLDEDRAVRGAGLARLYLRAGLTDLSLREAARAVASDYADYSSHLFLAETYDALRDPTRFNLRHETAWFNELLLADLLAPVGAGTFSPNVSQQEYTRLFTAEGLSIASVTDYRSDGQFRQLATQSGFFGNTAWSLDVDYQRNEGVRPNNTLDRIEWYSQIKQQVTARDTALLLVKFQDYRSGDNFQHLDPLDLTNGYSPSFRYDEEQKPIAVAGWRHEWSPGIQTLALAGRLENDQRFRQDGVEGRELVVDPDGTVRSAGAVGGADVRLRGRLETYTAELSQIMQFERGRSGQHTFVFGGRFQDGTFDTRDHFGDLTGFLKDDYAAALAADRAFTEDFRRWSAYAYETWSPVERLQLTAGLAYDGLTYPANFRRPPLSFGESTRQGWLPKAAVVWTPWRQATLRGMWARSLGGVSLDESYRLEPVQLAGFSQTFRTLIPESIVGSLSAPGFDVGGVALDLKLPARTYLGLRGDFLRSDADETAGVFEFPNGAGPGSGRTAAALEQFRFREDSVGAAVDKLLGEEWSLGAAWRFQRTRLDDSFPSAGTIAMRSADLHEFALRTGWNHASGWFARTDARWLLQAHDGAVLGAGHGDEDTCQVDVQLGWRFPRQSGEVSAGILNLLGGDHRLDPLSGLPEFARERVFFGRLKLYF